MLKTLRVVLLFALTFIVSISAISTPQFARQYNLECSSCHVHVPKLNAFGEEFVANNYQMKDRVSQSTLPLSVWLSQLSQTRQNAPEKINSIPNRIEFISAGHDEQTNTSYFIEWRALSLEILSDGKIRDRSGRFEDIFVIFELPSDFQLQVGQYRSLSQVDVSRRLSISEPLVFSSGLSGTSSNSSRLSSLRSFSPGGRSPSVRITHVKKAPDSNEGLFSSLTIPFAGELSVPLTDDAKTNASCELEGTPKGYFVESYYRKGLNSIGLNAFFGNNSRRYYGVVGQHHCNDFFFSGGLARAEVAGSKDWRYSISGEWVPHHSFALGMRADHRDAGGHPTMFIPYFSYLQKNGKSAYKIQFEARIRDNSFPQFLIELGAMF